MWCVLKLKGKERYRRGKGKRATLFFFYLRKEKKRIRGGVGKKLTLFGPGYSMRTVGLCRTNARVCERIPLRRLATATCLLACVGGYSMLSILWQPSRRENRKSSTSFPQRQIERTIFFQDSLQGRSATARSRSRKAGTCTTEELTGNL